MRRLWRSTTAPALVVTLACSASAAAQSPARVSLDTTVSVDTVRGDNAVHRPNIIIDVAATVRLTDGWMAYVRPWFRQPRADTWDKQIYQAALQYQRRGRVSTRIDAGYIASPVGLGMMDSRPSVNPMIMPHLAYFVPMPGFDKGTPRLTPIAGTYPLGGMVTLSTAKWDGRLALVNSAPTRVFVLGAEGTPRPTAVIEGGVGVSPLTGLRLGVSFARGDYASRSELTVPSTRGRRLTQVGFESEFGFGHTTLSGEVIRDALETAAGDAFAYEWFVQGTETLTPRWFVAGRTEGTSAPGLRTTTAVGARTVFRVDEATVGFRLSPSFTFRGSAIGRKAFTRPDWDRQVAVSVVWLHRWR